MGAVGGVVLQHPTFCNKPKRAERRAMASKHVMKFQGVRIAGTGSYLPERVVSNDELIKQYDLKISSDKIVKAVGVRLRHQAAPTERCSDLAYHASVRALESAGLKPEDLDMILVSANPGDGQTPETSSVLRLRLGLRECPAFDVRMACTGWIAAVQTALMHMTHGGYERVLVAASAILSRETNWGNPFYRTIFGDAAGAVVLERSDKAAAFPWFTRIWSGATRQEGALTIYHGYPQLSVPTESVPADWPGNFYMADRSYYFETVSTYLRRHVDEVFADAGCSRNDVDVAFAHFPSRDLCDHAIEASGIPHDRVFNGTDETVGNIIAAEMPFKIDQAVRSGRLQRGNRVAVVDYGAGFTSGVMLFQY